MTPELVVSLALQIAALTLLFHQLRKRIFQHPGALFILAAVTYHGVAEVANRLVPSGIQRYGLSTSDLDHWMVVVGPGILLFTIAYLIALRAHDLPHKPATASFAQTEALLDWKLLALITIPLYLTALAGGSSTLSGSATNGAGYVQTGLISQFLIILMVLFSFSLINAFGSRYILPVLIGQSILLLLLGERLPVLAAMLMLFFALAISGIHMTRSQLVRLLVIVLLSIVALTASRYTTSGRAAYATGSGATERLTNLTLGLLHPQFLLSHVDSQFVYRLDGNDFASYVVKGMRSGIPPVGLSTFEHDITLAIPSFVDPSKLSGGPISTDEELAFETHFQMPPMNRLPTFMGTLVGYFGIWWFELLIFFVGLMFGIVDRWLQRATPTRIVLGIALVYCVALYEEGLAIYSVTLRGAILLIVLVEIVGFMRDVARRRSGVGGTLSSDAGRTILVTHDFLSTSADEE